MTLVTTNGCFDGLHPGHLFFLGFCRGQGDELVVGINSDDYIRRRKKREPMLQEQRKDELMALRFIKTVSIFYEDDPCRFIDLWRPAIHCIGEEYRNTARELDTCDRLRVKVVYVPRIGEWSSTELRGGMAR